MSAKAKAKVVWKGPRPLRRDLVPVGELRQHPENPRRGDVDAIAASLERFGQVRHIAAVEDGTIVYGNHTYEAAGRLGWSHVAALRLPMDEDTARAYLAADNRTGDLARYDDGSLAELLERLAEGDDAPGLVGTGFEQRDLAALLRRVAPESPDSFQTISPDDVKTEYECPRCGFEW